MRLFANLFLILFAADAGVSLLDELTSLLFPLPVLSLLRVFLANIVLIMAIFVYLSLGIDRRLPKRVFLPLVLFVCLAPLSLWVFPSFSGTRTYGLLAAAAQLFLCLVPIFQFRKGSNRSLLMPEALFDAPFFSLRNTLMMGALNTLVLPFVLVLLVFSSANSYLQKNTSGFMRLAPDGVYMSEKVYKRNNKTIRLAAMIHVGEKQYYDEVVGSVAPGRTIVLAEGVTDEKKLLTNRLDYGKVADYLGLTLQQEKMHFQGRIIDASELDDRRARSRGDGANSAAQVDILRADVDVSSFRPPTIQLLNALGKQMKENSSLAKGLLASSAWSDKNLTPEMQKVVMDDILYRRNKEVIRHLNKALDRYDTIVIPWGALHMAEIEEEVLRQGFRLQQVRERVSMDFRKMIKSK